MVQMLAIVNALIHVMFLRKQTKSKLQKFFNVLLTNQAHKVQASSVFQSNGMIVMTQIFISMNQKMTEEENIFITVSYQTERQEPFQIWMQMQEDAQLAHQQKTLSIKGTEARQNHLMENIKYNSAFTGHILEVIPLLIVWLLSWETRFSVGQTETSFIVEIELSIGLITKETWDA